MLMVSACLCGENCKYNGSNNENQKIIDFLKDKEYITICPEQIGGLSTPRKPAEIIGTARGVLDGIDKIITVDDKDVTSEFIIGAKESLTIAKKNNVSKAILKAKSPSCGKGLVYDGTFNGRRISGNGITAEILLENGIKVLTEEDF